MLVSLIKHVGKAIRDSQVQPRRTHERYTHVCVSACVVLLIASSSHGESMIDWLVGWPLCL